MCCEDCRTEKLKSNILNKILLKEHHNIIKVFLGCDDCIKLNAILNDPILKKKKNKQTNLNNNKYLR